MSKTIILDMDGVCADLVGGIAKLYGIPRTTLINDMWVPGMYNIPDILGVEDDDLWHRVMVAGDEFWKTLKLTQQFCAMKEAVNFYKLKCVIGTAVPSMREDAPYGSWVRMSAMLGKMTWLRQWSKFQDICFLHDKSVLAQEDTFLIDDCDANVTPFIERGGKGVLVPRIWNSRHAESHNEDHVTEIVLEAIRKFATE